MNISLDPKREIKVWTEIFTHKYEILNFWKGETKEEKKKRKQAVKEAKRDRRIEKKETRAAFAQEFQEESRKVTTQTIRLN